MASVFSLLVLSCGSPSLGTTSSPQVATTVVTTTLAVATTTTTLSPTTTTTTPPPTTTTTLERVPPQSGFFVVPEPRYWDAVLLTGRDLGGDSEEEEDLYVAYRLEIGDEVLAPFSGGAFSGGSRLLLGQWHSFGTVWSRAESGDIYDSTGVVMHVIGNGLIVTVNAPISSFDLGDTVATMKQPSRVIDGSGLNVVIAFTKYVNGEEVRLDEDSLRSHFTFLFPED